MHAQASYFDAFWQESCSGQHLAKYFNTNFELESYRYKPDGEIIVTPNGAISRYEAFNGDDESLLTPIFNGADVFTMSDGLIMTVSDYYCEPTDLVLIELAGVVEGQHGRASVARRGLGAKTAGHIVRRLTEVAADPSIILDVSLTVTSLAGHVGCEVMDLFYVLEEVQDSTFLEFVEGSRARHASTMMVDAADGGVRFEWQANFLKS